MSGIAIWLASSFMQLTTADYGDPRIELVAYRSDRVVPVEVAAGYAAVIELAPDESIESVVLGNGAVWQVTETGRGNRIVVKPSAGAATTNMVVLTDLRRYVFLLQPSETNGRSAFVIRFSFPSAAAQGQPQSSPSVTYRFRGNRRLYPVSMRDDGKRTIITWGKDQTLPAMLVVSGGAESIVNGHMAGNDFVIEGIADHYVFRYGNTSAVADRRIVGRVK
jgi:type IV secretion system protein VirB9